MLDLQECDVVWLTGPGPGGHRVVVLSSPLSAPAEFAAPVPGQLVPISAPPRLPILLQLTLACLGGSWQLPTQRTHDSLSQCDYSFGNKNAV